MGEILWFLADALLGVVFEAIFELVGWLIRRVIPGRGGEPSDGEIRRGAWFGLAGLALGFASALIFRPPVANPEWFRFARLALIPPATGGALAAWDSRIGAASRAKTTHAFLVGAKFGLGFALARLLFLALAAKS